MPALLASRVVEHQAHIYRKFWRGSAFAYVLNPLMFLAALGLGVGGLVKQGNGTVDGIAYLAFITPGVMAASAMQGAASESLWPIMAGTKWIRTFHAMVATPVGPGDVYLGVVVWTGVRAAIGSTIFLVIAALLGGVLSWWAPLAIPAAVLTALAFAAPLAAFAATQDTDFRFPVIMRLGVVPLFLFSGTFFPVSQLPDWLQPFCWLSPLWHGVQLCRGATTGSIDPPEAVANVAILVAIVLAGAAWGIRTFTRKLAT
ncbi:MAG: ABC transporter permease [Acidimicrobiia bacterium]